MTPQKMEQILEFCMGKIPDDDLMKVEEILSKGIRDKDMAADARLMRKARLAADCAVRGYKVQQKRVAMDIAQDRDAILALMPNMFRLSTGKPAALTMAVPIPPKKSKPMTAAEKAEAQAMFPNMKLH